MTLKNDIKELREMCGGTIGPRTGIVLGVCDFAEKAINPLSPEKIAFAQIAKVCDMALDDDACVEYKNSAFQIIKNIISALPQKQD